MIFEPVLGEGGYVVPGSEFLSGVETLCREHGIITIADGIQSGFGRTGRFLASDHFGLDPDIVILAKALAAGYPLSAVVAATSWTCPVRRRSEERTSGTPSRAPLRTRCST